MHSLSISLDIEISLRFWGKFSNPSLLNFQSKLELQITVFLYIKREPRALQGVCWDGKSLLPPAAGRS